jgi:hypothetical protein
MPTPLFRKPITGIVARCAEQKTKSRRLTCWQPAVPRRHGRSPREIAAMNCSVTSFVYHNILRGADVVEDRPFAVSPSEFRFTSKRGR